MVLRTTLKRALPVGERLVERHIDVDPRCKRCGEIESIAHLLFQCQFAQKVWVLAPFAAEKDYRGIIDLLTSWPDLCYQTCLPPSGLTSTSLFPWILWSIWKARNRFVFENFSATPEEILSTAIKLAREWSSNNKPESGVTTKRTLPALESPIDTLVVRSDGAWKAETNEAGLGWILMATSRMREFKETREFVASPLMAEGLALREAVLTCQRQDLRKLRFEVDSKQLVMSLNSGSSVAEIHSVVSDIFKSVCWF